MTVTNLQPVAEEVVRLAQQQGYIVAREVREVLSRTGHSESLVDDVLALAPALCYRRGRYYYNDPQADHLAVVSNREVETAVERLVTLHKNAASRVERRERGRVDFVQPVQVVTEDNRDYTLLTRDLSATGVRMIGTRRLLGQKVRVLIPAGDITLEFSVRILWTCPVGDDLVENGGAFLGVKTPPGS